MRTAVAVATMAAMASAEFQRPAFCKDLECPVFKTEAPIQVGAETVEVRRYAAARWTSSTEGFMSLFRYIQGDNAADQTIEMTAPVRKLYDEKDNTEWTSFYAPYKFQAPAPAAPTPTGKGVQSAETKEMRVAVLSYGGFNWGNTAERKHKALVDLLDKAGVKHADTWTYAGYDSPFTLFNRHNEIWVELL